MSKTAYIDESEAMRVGGREATVCRGFAGRLEPAARRASVVFVEGVSGCSVGAGADLNEALAECAAAGIEVLSSLPEWVELSIPCDLSALPILQKLLARLDADLPAEVCEAIEYAFREMLANAVEYGCRLDPRERVEVRFVRLKRALLCRIKDPGEGFDPGRLGHAAVSNPDGDPLRHASVREGLGLRPGGFGILLTSRLVDELVYNERHNELLFVKYLSRTEEVNE